MSIKKKNSKSFYKQVKQKILEKIESGNYKPDERIPSERELCDTYSVSRTTIRKAIDELESEGFLNRQSGRGTFVAKSNIGIKSKTGNILFMRCVHSDIDKSTSKVKDDIFYPQILAGVEKASSENNYHCFYKIVNEKKFREEEIEKAIKNCDGIVCAELHSESFLECLKKTSKPVVLICPSVKDTKFDVVEIDNLEGAIKAVNYFIRGGHKKIAFIGGSEESIASKERKEGYLRILNQYDLAVNHSYILSYGWRLEDGYNAVLDLLKEKTIPTAIFAASDLLAIGAINAIKDSGYKVPDDISVIGFDDIEMSSQIRPALTTIAVNKQAMGQEAAKLIFKCLKDNRDYPIKVSIPTVFRERHSCINKIL